MAIEIKPVHGDRGKVDLQDDSVIRHWTKTFGASKEAIAAAIEKVGNNPETVRKEIAAANGCANPGLQKTPASQ